MLHPVFLISGLCRLVGGACLSVSFVYFRRLAELTQGISMIIPRILRNTVGVVIVASRKYIDWLEVLHRYASLTSAAISGASLILWQICRLLCVVVSHLDFLEPTHPRTAAYR